LTLRARVGRLAFQLKLAPGRTATKGTPHSAHAVGPLLFGWLEGEFAALATGLTPEIAEACVLVPGAEADVAGWQRMLRVAVLEEGLSVDRYFERRSGPSHGQRYPPVGWHLTGDVAQPLEIPPVRAQRQMSGGREGDFVAGKDVRPRARVAHVDN